ncbi:hypothetical protein ACLMJK_000963 [Lecanora helva]
MLCYRMLFQNASFVRSALGQNVKAYSKQYLKIPALNVCRVSIHPTHQPSHTSSIILKDTSHVLCPRVRQRYDPVIKGRYNELEEGLWIMLTSNTMQGKKAVRSWAKRRIAQAMKQELSARGYDGEGRRVSTGAVSEDAIGESKRRPDMLIGTVDIEVFSHSMGIGFAEVQNQMGLVVEEVLRICGRQGGGKKIKRN